MILWFRYHWHYHLLLPYINLISLIRSLTKCIGEKNPFWLSCFSFNFFFFFCPYDWLVYLLKFSLCYHGFIIEKKFLFKMFNLWLRKKSFKIFNIILYHIHICKDPYRVHSCQIGICIINYFLYVFVLDIVSNIIS